MGVGGKIRKAAGCFRRPRGSGVRWRLAERLPRPLVLGQNMNVVIEFGDAVFMGVAVAVAG